MLLRAQARVWAKGPAEAELESRAMPLVRTKAVSDTGMRCFSGAILHKGDTSKIGKLNSFEPGTMAAVEATARAARGAEVMAGHGSGHMERREAGLSSHLYSTLRVWHGPWFTSSDAGLRNLTSTLGDILSMFNFESARVKKCCQGSCFWPPLRGFAVPVSI